MENWIHPPIIDTELFCDASDFAWGSVFEKKPTGGAWPKTENKYNINEKELLDLFYTLKSFKFDLQGKHVKTFSDSTTVVAVTNQICTCKSNVLNKRPQQIMAFVNNLISGLQLPISQARKILRQNLNLGENIKMQSGC